MLPVVDKPAIQYVVEEAVSAGITDILIITGRGKRSIENHFDRSFELEYWLEQKGDEAKLNSVKAISEMADIHYIRQKQPLGLGHAVLTAEAHVGDQPFAVLLGDDILADPLLPKMVDTYEQYGRSVLSLLEVPREDIRFYGSVQPEPIGENLVKVLDIVEKPEPEKAPSNLAAIGRYVLTPEIFGALRNIGPGVGGEIQLTDAIRDLIKIQAVYGYIFEGVRYDIGKKIDYLRATVELASERDDLGAEFREFLTEFVTRKKLV
jgi:UTP--glucose-1-phosphate uridylyltransferase